jgi:hypothetical protein
MRIAAVLGAAMLAACSSSSPEAVHLPAAAPATNSGFVAFSTAGDRYKLFLPAAQPPDGRSLLVVADAAARDGTNGVIRYVVLPTNADPIAVGADGDDVVVADAALPRAFILGATSEAVRATVPLPSGAVPFPVSDNDIYATGVAVDAARRRAWLSTSLGAAEIDLDAHVVTTVWPAPPSENFAYDASTSRLYLPFYLCDPAGPDFCDPYAQPGGPDLTDSLTVVDLATRRTYAVVDPAAVDTHAPLGFQPDAVAIDPGLGVVAIPTEDPPQLQIVEQAAATFDPGTGTAGLPVRLTVPLPTPLFSSLTVDPNTHLAVVAEEGGPGILFVDLSLAKAGTLHVTEFAMPTLPDLDSWQARVDPHGATVGVIDGRPQAFLVSFDRTWIARIDLRTVAGLANLDETGFLGAVSYFLVPVAPPP